MDTIAAIASAPGGAARGIIRLSGNDVVQCVERCFSPNGGVRLSEVRRAQVVSGNLSLAGYYSPLPCDLYLWPTNRSYTGNPSAELHTIGSPPLLEAALHALCQAGARLAEPGEFTLRAFLAGRLDLVQAEAVLGVIDANDSVQLRAALDQLAGGLSKPLGKLRDDLLNLLADLEAGLDFVEEDIEFVTSEDLQRRLSEAAGQVQGLADQLASRGQTTESMRVVLVGSPNAGKSSLFNALLANEAALVSDVPGTTRDYLTAKIELDGIQCELVDTAGTEGCSALDEIGQAAQKMTRGQAQAAQLRLLCVDSSCGPDADGRARIEEGDFDLLLLTKCDQRAAWTAPSSAIETSSATRSGLDRLRSAIRDAVLTKTSTSGAVASTVARCSDSLRLAAQSLERASRLAADAAGDELVASEIRTALNELGKVVGAVYTDDVLDRIFSRFCIGK